MKEHSISFTNGDEDWKELAKAMMILRSDCCPKYAHDSGYLLNKRLEE